VISALALAWALAGAPSPSPVPAAKDNEVERVLVVVGHNGGAPDPRTPLRFADDDAARLFEALLPTARRGFLLATFDKESARLFPELLDTATEPSKENLARVLGEAFWILRQHKQDGRATELVFAFAGHGDVSDAGEGFVVLSDGVLTKSDLETQVIEASPADTNHVVIDACASYFMVQSRGDASESKAVPLTPQLLGVIQGGASAAARARTGVLVSTSDAAEVHESGELSSGVFSFLLRSALAGAGDVNRDGRVEYGEASAFIAQASAGLSDPRARLQVFARAPQQKPHAALLDMKTLGATRFLAIDDGAATHLRVLDARGLPYAEVHTDGAPVLLALVGQPFFVVRRTTDKGDEEAVLVPRSAGAYSVRSLSFEAPDRARTASAPGGLGPHAGLFAAPFTRAYVDGFLQAGDLLAPAAAPAFDVAYAKGGDAPITIPLDVIGLSTLGVAGALGVGAGVAVVGNQLAFQTLSRSYAETGVVDQRQALEVEGWRTAASALSVAALGVGLLGGGVYLLSRRTDDGAWELRP
jgi:hypothetical protein